MTDLIYLDLQAKNVFNSSNVKSPLQFEDNRDSIIINNAGEYEISVVRFQTDTNLLPVLTATIQPNSINPNETVYKVTFEYLTNSVTKTIIWEPETLNIPTPPAPSTLPFGLQLDNTEYYNCLNYQHFIDLINKQLRQGWIDLQTIDPLVIGSPPYLGWNTSSLTAELFVPTSCDTDVAGNVKIYFNTPLFDLFSSFSAKGVFSSPERDYQLMTSSNNTYNVVGSSIVLKQNYSTISNWSPVSSIAFSSSNLPVSPGLVSSPLVSQGNQTLPTSGSSNNTLQIISDISANDQSYKPNIIYNPSAEYRFISLLSSTPISNVQVSVFYKTTSGLFFPLNIGSGGSASIKILFRKKQ